jgi:pimeloyl-ACP methyl ester carboxylesterase
MPRIIHGAAAFALAVFGHDWRLAMHRRVLTLAAIAALLLTACTSTSSAPFISSRISVATRGAGPDVVLIPGLTGHAERAWGDVMDTLDDRYRLHIVQVHGFAGVAPGANAQGPVAAPAAEEIARYIREARLERPAVIGHSMGGVIGMMVAARHPELAGRLMVVDMIPFMGEMFGPAAATPEGLSDVAEVARAQILTTPLEKGMLSQMFEGMTSKAELRPVLMQQLRESNQRTVANAFHELIVTDLRPELPRIAAPVTVLYVHPVHTMTPMTEEQFDAAITRLYANVPNAKLIKIANSRHFIQWDQPERFLAEVDAFMRR